MRSLASPSAFAQTCATMLERMLNTVPAGVQLTDEIQLLPVKVSDAQLTVINSQLVFTTLLRLSRPDNTTVPAGRAVTLFWCDRGGQFKDCARNSVSVAKSPQHTDITPSPLGISTNIALDGYRFVVALSPNQSLSKFWFEVDEGNGSAPLTYNNGGGSYLIDQDTVICVPALSQGNFIKNTQNQNFTIVVGIRDDINVTGGTMFAYISNDAPPTLNATVPLHHNTTGTIVAGYSYYYGNIVGPAFAMTTLDFEVVGADNVTYKVDYMQTRSIGPVFFANVPLSSATTTTLSSTAVPTTTAKASAASAMSTSLFIPLVNIMACAALLLFSGFFP